METHVAVSVNEDCPGNGSSGAHHETTRLGHAPHMHASILTCAQLTLCYTDTRRDPSRPPERTFERRARLRANTPRQSTRPRVAAAYRWDNRPGLGLKPKSLVDNAYLSNPNSSNTISSIDSTPEQKCVRGIESTGRCNKAKRARRAVPSDHTDEHMGAGTGREGASTRPRQITGVPFRKRGGRHSMQRPRKASWYPQTK